MVQKKKPIELPALWETMRELFPDSETRKEKTEELVLKAATKNDDETTLHWIMVLLAPDIDVGLPCEKKIDYLKNLYWKLPQHYGNSRVEGHSENIFALPKTKRWILEQIIQYWQPGHIEIGKLVLQFFCAVYSPLVYSIVVFPKLSYETEDDVCARGRCSNPEEQKIIENVLRAHTNKSFGWQEIEKVLNGIRRTEHTGPLWEILIHAWARSGGYHRLATFFHYDKVFCGVPSGSVLSDEALCLVGKFVNEIACLEYSIGQLKARLSTVLHGVVEHSFIVKYSSLDAVELLIDFTNIAIGDLHMFDAPIVSVIEKWQKETEIAYGKRIHLQVNERKGAFGRQVPICS